MTSPFTDFAGNATENYTPVYQPTNTLEFEGPFVDNFINAADENFYTEYEDFEREPEPAYSNELEEESSAGDLRKAVDLNRKYMTMYQWQNYSKRILKEIGIVNSDAVDVESKEGIETFTKYFADWQESHGYKTNLKGVFGLNNWTYFQKKIGLHSLSNRHNIDLKKAVKDNAYYEKRNWQAEKENIYKFLASNKITKEALPLNDEYFAYAIADLQSLKGFFVDGILGPRTLASIGGLNIPDRVLPTSSTTFKKSKWHNFIKNTVSCATEPLVYGKSTFAAVVKAIQTAKDENHYIYIAGWMLDITFPLLPNDPSTTLSLLLQNAMNNGVEVRVLVWGGNPYYQDELKKAEAIINNRSIQNGNGLLIKDNVTYGSPILAQGLHALRVAIAAVPSPVASLLSNLDTWKTLNKYSNVSNEGSHHEKIIIVKGSEGLIGFCGGVDINPDRIGAFENDKITPREIKGFDENGMPEIACSWNQPLEILHDVHCKLNGKGAFQLLQRFIWRWRQAFRGNQDIRMGAKLRGENDAAPADALYGDGISNVKIISTFNQNNGAIIDRSIYNTVVTAITNAETSVHLECQYMISVEIAKLLNYKLKTPGFTVSILTQDDKFARADIPIIKKMRKAFLDALYGGADRSNPKISIWSLDPDAAFPARHKVHSKLYIVDRELIIIGSANCSRRSMTHDSETAAVIFNDGENKNKFVDLIETKYEKITKWIPYKPNDKVKDIDIELTEKINDFFSSSSTLSIGLGVALGASGIIQLIGPFILQLPPIIQMIVDPYDVRVLNDEETMPNFEEYLLVNENPLASPTNLKFSPATATFFSPEINSDKTKKNTYSLSKSGVTVAAITAALSQTIDLGFIQLFLTDMNTRATGVKYQIDTSYTTFDAVLTEAIHQFQISNFLNSDEHDGILGQSTLETLGIFNHGLKSKLNSAGFYGQSQLNRSDVKPQVPVLTNSEFTAVNWYQSIVKPAWLGVKISDGVHILLYRKLKEAETWLAAQPQYAGLSAAKIGAAIGFNADTRFSGARLSSDKQAMHGFGLALDINVNGNPWIGAGWVKYDTELLKERTRMLTALKNASGNSQLPGSNVFEYLHSIAQFSGNDTRQAYQTLKSRSDEFVKYLKSNSAELSYWNKSQSFGSRNPLNGFLNLHADLVYALRHVAGLAWGALDFGPRANGDIMHFDLRTIGIGKLLCSKVGGYVPSAGHPLIANESFVAEEFYDETEESEKLNMYDLNEAMHHQDEAVFESLESTTRPAGNNTFKKPVAFVTIKGHKQGVIKGNVIQKGKEGSIAVFQIQHQVMSPRDAASGMATGKRIHKPVTIIKEVDTASVKLMNALITNESLNEVIINCWRPQSAGNITNAAGDVNYYRIKLTDAFISNISQNLGAENNTTEKKYAATEIIELWYKKIEWNYLEGAAVRGEDDLQTMNELTLHEAIEEAEGDESRGVFEVDLADEADLFS